MYLHLGGDCVIWTSGIVGIFDLDNATLGKTTRQFLADAQKGGRVVTVSEELPKSFVVCNDRLRGETVYITQVSTATLKKRMNMDA